MPRGAGEPRPAASRPWTPRTAAKRYLLGPTLSRRVTDLGVTFLTRLGYPQGADADPRGRPRRASGPGALHIADSDTVVAIAADPGSSVRAWLSGRLKAQGSVLDPLHPRKLAVAAASAARAGVAGKLGSRARG